jgi:proline iminopeptidase
VRVAVNETELYFDVEGTEFVIASDGLRRRPTIVALHGGPGFDQGYLRPGLAPLGRLAQILYVDLRGQGRSAPAALETCTLEQMADDVAALCMTLGIERPVLFGHSAGGFVALHLAIRHPALAAGLILCGTSPTLAPTNDGLPSPPSLAERAGPEAAAIASRLFGGDMSPETGEGFNKHVLPFYAGPSHMDLPGPLMALSGFTPAVALYFFGTLARAYDLRPRLHEITVPVLVITGRYDWICPPSAGRAIAAGIPGAKLIEFVDSGHFTFSEEPDKFRASVSDFLAGLPQPLLGTAETSAVANGQ